MRGQPGPSDLWGKFRDESRGGPAWHPLIDHCTDVACVLEALLAQPTIRRRLARAGGLDDLDPIQVARLCFLGFIHDLGKCAAGFQAKASEPPVIGVGHIRALRGLCADDLAARFTAAIDAPTLLGWGEASVWELLAAAFAHHGRPVELEFNSLQDGPLRATWLARAGVEPMARLAGLVANGRALFSEAFGIGAPLPAGRPFQHLFAGLLMLADWLGSGDTSDMFPYSEPGEDRLALARGRAPEVLRRVGLAPAPPRQATTGMLPGFQAQFGFAPRPAQAEIDALPVPPRGGVVLLESETGSGKTEAALRWATRLIADGQVDGLFFAVPLRSAAVQLHRRMQAWLDNTFPGTEALLAVPGYFRMGEAEGRTLPDFAVQWTDGAPEDRQLGRWAAEQPKRYAAAAFAVGTIDQALMAVLQVNHAHLRAACLARHLLVVDEVHGSDPYMRVLVRRLIELFQACGGQILLMSATLGAAAREKLLRGVSRPTPLAEAMARPYPLISTSWGAAAEPRPEGRSKRVATSLRPWLDDPEAIAAAAVAAADAGARMLILRNTVAAAIATQQAIEGRLGPHHAALFRVGDGKISTLHHGRFAAEDRRLLDDAIQDRVGKKAAAGAAIVVATQTVEQSLDVDFDLLLTDLCPIDVLLQRIGRLHRHERHRPGAFAQARCIVLEPDGGDLASFLTASRHGLGFGRDGQARAYPDLRAVEATRRLIGPGNVWTIPDDNRRLVEQGTHPEALDTLAAGLDERWRQHGKTKQAKDMAEASIARDNAIDFTQPFSKLAFPERGIKIATRLGLDDLLLPLDRPLISPFGQTLQRLRLPGWMIRCETWRAIKAVDDPRIVVTDAGHLDLYGQRFVYDRFGIGRQHDGVTSPTFLSN